MGPLPGSLGQRGVKDTAHPRHGDRVMAPLVCGRQPCGRLAGRAPGALCKDRSWDDYSLGRADAMEHLGALDVVDDSVIVDHRRAMEKLEDLDLVSHDILIQQLADLEQFQWFIRAHLETSSGDLATAKAHTEVEAAAAARQKTTR